MKAYGSPLGAPQSCRSQICAGYSQVAAVVPGHLKKYQGVHFSACILLYKSLYIIIHKTEQGRDSMGKTMISLQIDENEKLSLEEMAHIHGMTQSELLRKGAKLYGSLPPDFLKQMKESLQMQWNCPSQPS